MNIDDLAHEMEKLNPSDYLSAAMNAKRPYNGQPWTDTGERGKQLVEGLTMRDIRDCFVVAAFHSAGLGPSEYPESVYQLPWGEIDPLAHAQNLTCEIERRMGIFPNIPKTAV